MFDDFSLTLTQRDIYFDQLRRPGSPLYNVGGYLRLGKIDLGKALNAHKAVIQGHDAFGIRIVNTESGVRQRIVRERTTELPVIDMSGSASPDQEAKAWVSRLFEESLVVEDSELFRSFLLKLGESEYWYVGMAHHVTIDGWGFANWGRSFADHYRSCGSIAGTFSWQDYAGGDDAYFLSPRYAIDKAYWLAQCASPPDRLLSPFHALTRNNKLGARSLRHTLTIGVSEFLAIRTLAEKLKASNAQVLLGILISCLGTCYDRDDIIVGLPVHNRSGAAQKKAIGVFTGVIPLRLNRTSGRNFSQLIRHVGDRQRGNFRHRKYPVGDTIRDLGFSRIENALYDLVFSYLKIDDDLSVEASTSKLDYVSNHHETTPLMVTVWEGEAGAVEVELDCNTSYFNSEEAGLLAERLIHVMRRALQSPDIELGIADVIPTPERTRLLRDFNATAARHPEKRLIHELFESQAAERPDATALVFDGQTLSYAELNRRANQLAHRLVDLGVKPDDRVAICAERSMEMVVGLLGILKAGGAYVPLDPLYPAERLAHMLEDSAPMALLSQSALRDTLPLLQSSSVPVLILDDVTQSSSSQHDWDPRVPGLTSRHLAYVIYTSGSTGRPKGVMIEHANTMNLLAWATTAFSAVELSNTLQSTSINFDLAVFELFVPLSTGASVHLVKDMMSAGARLVATTLVNTVPSAIAAVVAEGRLSSTVTTVNLAGEPLKRELVERVFASSDAQAVVNLYGPSETTTYSTWVRVDRASGFVAHIGRPIANTQVYILNAQGQLLPIGVAGEIHIGGAGVARGYLNRPELTAERFLQDPFSNDADARMYRTGDLGRWLADGNIEYLGRNDFQVKIRGFRIELGEIEAKLGACAGVREAVVIAREDTPGDKRLVAYVVADAGDALSLASLREALQRELPEYMIPSVFVMLEALPLTPNGKLDRNALSAPDQSSAASRAYETAAGELEQAIATIWQELLGLERVGRHDHFFELGGHSLLAARLVTRLRALLGVEVALRDVFAQPTLAGLARTVSLASSSSQTAIVAVDRSEALPLSWAQQRLWFMDQLDHAAGAAYHLPAELRLSGALNHEALRETLDRIVARHENLRTTFVSVEGSPRQVIAAEDSGFMLIDHDLSHLDEAAQAPAVAALSVSEARAPFDLSRGPLIRGRLLRLSEHEHVLLVTQHHIISDGRSIGVLVKEVSALYTAFSQGEPDPLPPLPIQYADYAAGQRQWLQGDVLQQQLDFWRTHLSRAPALLELPTDRPRPAV